MGSSVPPPRPDPAQPTVRWRGAFPHFQPVRKEHEHGNARQRQQQRPWPNCWTASPPLTGRTGPPCCMQPTGSLNGWQPACCTATGTEATGISAPPPWCRARQAHLEATFDADPNSPAAADLIEEVALLRRRLQQLEGATRPLTLEPRQTAAQAPRVVHGHHAASPGCAVATIRPHGAARWPGAGAKPPPPSNSPSRLQALEQTEQSPARAGIKAQRHRPVRASANRQAPAPTVRAMRARTRPGVNRALPAAHPATGAAAPRRRAAPARQAVASPPRCGAAAVWRALASRASAAKSFRRAEGFSRARWTRDPATTVRQSCWPCGAPPVPWWRGTVRPRRLPRRARAQRLPPVTQQRGERGDVAQRCAQVVRDGVQQPSMRPGTAHQTARSDGHSTVGLLHQALPF